jgi:hypothetical protein
MLIFKVHAVWWLLSLNYDAKKGLLLFSHKKEANYAADR